MAGCLGQNLQNWQLAFPRGGAISSVNSDTALEERGGRLRRSHFEAVGLRLGL